MTYTVHYWRQNLVHLTGFEHHSEIDDEELNALLVSKKANVMIQHVAEAGDNPAVSYCYIDDLNHRFQSR